MEELILSNLETYGVLAVIIWMFVEEVLPVPSVLAPMAAAAVVVNTSNPVYAFLEVFVVVAVLGSAASVASSYLTYSLGFYGGKPGIERFGKYFGINWGQIKGFENHLTSGNEHVYIAGLRAIPLMPLSVISASSGFFRVNWKLYGVWSFIGMVPRNLLLGMIGWHLKDDFTSIAVLIEEISIIIVIFGGLVLGAAFLYYRKRLGRRYRKSKGMFFKRR